MIPQILTGIIRLISTIALLSANSSNISVDVYPTFQEEEVYRARTRPTLLVFIEGAHGYWVAVYSQCISILVTDFCYP